MKVATYNQEGKEAEKVELPATLFDVAWNADLVHQIITIQQGNQRQVSAKVKDRGEVRGGGKKPWRQKGTGRARHGSRRSPIWVGGGVTHGPTAERNFKRKLNLKMRKKALLSILSEKLRQKQVVVLDSLKLKSAKTKELTEILQGLSLGTKSTLVVLPTMDMGVIRAARNIPHVKTVQAQDLGILDVINCTSVVLPKESLPILEKRFGN